MVKILLLIEDQLEARQYSSSFRKIGFDVEAHSMEAGLADVILRFKADVIFFSVLGKKMNAMNVYRKIESLGGKSVKSIFVLRPNVGIAQADLSKIRIDSFISPGISFEDLLHNIGKLMQLDSNLWVEKFRREAQSVASDIEVKGEREAPQGPIVLPSAVSNKSRAEGYKRFLQGVQIAPESTITKNETRRLQKELQKELDPTEMTDLDLAKQAFVKALFRKK